MEKQMNEQPAAAKTGTSLNASFLVPGIGYLALACATLSFGLLQAEAASTPALLALVAAVSSFYAALGVCILRCKGRRFVLIGASLSCLLPPFGTVLGLTFLLWTRRMWNNDHAKAVQAGITALPDDSTLD
jgi:hypothetical protein